ncbi:MAG TPA: DUF2065 domain-containing protein [Aestuariivirgaceae bacterium]|nr:DUF2065 domain-containing protein [Aestuariivirgaceae bacterium]
MSDLVTALGLVLIIEGLVYAAAPARFKAMMARLEEIPDETLRMGGLIAVAAGVAIVWLARQAIA